ncbi:MAG: FAD-dependent monooxygenase [Okeania sp. SIO3H1]|uniref:FAD-dependent oxidoreductase n=1 Tax=Okeania sp. SIO1I7 TaxID=2607772 RepID=UPI0013CD48FE|nr:NAD(P)/FAD-dependent oxidoreductase [Okeania sp. SIO1I7]NEN91100.1 FAD-dependent monooxygenase [Okeania sp. SIO3H1]NET25210.1 FAD-dependent monooxygenase [Okeania sp. SIO1I7]
MQKIIIIGAGPVGLLLAHYLLSRRNYQVEIYERRLDPRLAEQSNQRTFPIALQSRGLNAIDRILGLKVALAKKGVWSQGVFIHSKQGKPRRINRKMPSLLIDRNQLNLVLLEHLLEKHSRDLVKVKFDCSCVGINLESQEAILQSNNGERFTTKYDRLVGADGVGSQVREVLTARADIQCQQNFIPDVYKSLHVPRIAPDKTVELAGNCLHTSTLDKGVRLVMAPQPDDWLHGTLIFSPDNNPLENCTTDEAVLAYFQENIPFLKPLMRLEDAAVLRQRPVSKILTVKCDRMHVGDRILLVGDAVHAVSPSIGQGCNASLQDVQVFAQCLDRYEDKWEEALPAFTAKRLSDIHALRELSDYTFPRSKPMMLEFIFRLTIGKKLRPWFPLLKNPLPMELIMESELPYSEVLKRGQGWINRVRQSMQN